MSKFCDKCGNELRNGNAKFCDKCGAKVKVTNNQNNAEITNMGMVVTCPYCGQNTTKGLPNCEKCGSSFEDNTVAVILGYIITFLLGIIGIIPAIYLLTRNNGKAKTHGIFIIGIIILEFVLLYMF